ncbi:YhbY family RNA-binding protein [Desulfamplus magnetovallimortis]|uniref:YhbY family RNA-binding protein n=1 Tax=Desulfamplus magnetovallimortis TaxID=1246637 RepID=UPI001FE3FC35|nr:YhbY family RNA-binding protein [Desulfamplus magnetovallimortis]
MERENIVFLKGAQRKYLRGLAHNYNPAAFVGHKGITDSLINEINDALEACELIKVKFVDFKERKIKSMMALDIAEKTDSHLAGLIGHVAFYYRQHKDQGKRKIVLP